MITYFIIFAVIGGALKGAETDKGIFIIIGIAILWGLTHAPIWGLVSLGEMMTGYVLVNYFNKST